MTAHYVHSFTGSVNDMRLRCDHHQLYQCDNNHYGIGGYDLSRRWIELVQDDHVTATTTIKDDGGSVTVRYGVRLSGENQLLEFSEIMDDVDDDDDKSTSSILRDRVLSINETLSVIQRDSKDGPAIKAVYNYPYAAQLQLVRTLRPPRSKDMSNSGNEKVSCKPPVYDASKDSFLVGPLRLFGVGEFHGEGEPRERTARVSVPTNGHEWDIYHNISPGDPRGHFLLLPALDYEREWRHQSLTSTDCYDVTYLASTIEPIGSMVLTFNSVSAGASQNHIHCHAWVNPPPPLLRINREYAVEKASALTSLQLRSEVTVSLLDYPCTCIKISASVSRFEETLKVMGDSLSKVVQIAAQSLKAPHNVAWMNSSGDAEKIQQLAIYVFFRKAEVTDRVDSVFRLGASEMLGVFHCSSNEQLDSISNNMKDILKDVSLEDSSSIWRSVCEALDTDTPRSK